ncbi:MAG TPA: D-2-hydroxyacid dehydrogenase family protein [Steroidobacteraceae bacterium]|nr:D-2-hydroxyacid dehydrogenase family protein [Steroidobacteraceae bacterium]
MSDEKATPTRREVLMAGIGIAASVAAGGAAAAPAKSPGKFRVAITGDFERLAMKAAPWNTLGEDAEVVTFTKPLGSVRDTVKALRDFDAVTLMHERVPLTREMLEQLPRLKLIVFSGNRNETLDDKAAADRNIIVCKSSPDFDVPADAPGGESPSELTIALLMACAWHTGAATTLIRQGGWAFRAGTALREKTLGILGYGGVGRPVARVAVALGMRVLVLDRKLTDETARAANVTRADLDTLLKNSDVVSIHLPLTAATRGMIGAQQIAQMKDGVILINTARAPIIDEQPFLDALRSRKIGMAGLDVYWEEPLPPHHPLRTLPNVVMTPHIGYVTEETMAVRYRGLLDTLLAYRKGNIIGRYTREERT